MARLGRRQAHQARKHDRVLLPRESIDAVVGGRPVGDGDAVERHHAGRHHGAGVQRRPAVRPVLLRTADRDDHPLRDARAVFLSRARLHGVRVPRAPIRSENAHLHERVVPGISRHVVRRDRGRAGGGPVSGSGLERHDDDAPHPGARRHLHDARGSAGGHLDRREDDGTHCVRAHHRHGVPREGAAEWRQRRRRADDRRRHRPAQSIRFRLHADRNLHVLVGHARAGCF